MAATWIGPNALPSHHAAWTWVGGSRPADLVVADTALPPPEPGAVLVRNAVIGLNPVDWKVLGHPSGWTSGKVPGCDGAGCVVAVAADVARDWLGARVCYHTALAQPGSFAAFTPVAARALMRVPDALSFEIAASLPCPALTAWLALRKVPDRANARVLIAGAGGGAGLYLVQLAKASGFGVATLSHTRHHARLAALGAEPVETAEPARYHAVIDSTGAAETLAPSLKANGHLVSILGRVATWPDSPFAQCWSLHEVALGALHRHGDAADWAELTTAGEAILAALATGAMQPEMLRIGDFGDLPIELEALRQRSFTGKALIRLP